MSPEDYLKILLDRAKDFYAQKLETNESISASDCIRDGIEFLELDIDYNNKNPLLAEISIPLVKTHEE